MTRLQHRGLNETFSPSRRAFLIGMAGAGFTFGFAPADAATNSAVAAAPSDFEPTIWYSIDRDGIVTVNIIRAEMGQHVGTALARILADELEADWDKVRIVAVDTDPKWGLMVTGGSWSVWMTFPVFSRAGAAGRIALVDEGARLLGVPAHQCVARNGAVVAARPVDLLRRNHPARRSPPHFHRRRIGEACRSSLPRSAGSSGAPSRRSTFPRRRTGRRATGSTRPSRAWSMRAQKFRRRATARASVRSTIPPQGA